MRRESRFGLRALALIITRRVLRGRGETVSSVFQANFSAFSGRDSQHQIARDLHIFPRVKTIVRFGARALVQLRSSIPSAERKSTEVAFRV